MTPRINAVAAGLALGCCLLAGRLAAQDGSTRQVRVPLGASSRERIVPSISSWKQRREAHVVMQEQDYSCGAAALATIAQFYFGDRVTEKEILDLILEQLKPAEVKDRQDNGLSMDDLFMAADKLGYQAAVAKITAKDLKGLEAPVLVRIIHDDYKHFVVVRGVVEDRIWIADPIRGNVRMTVGRFLEQWNGVALFVGKEGFGLPKKHGLAIGGTAPLRPELQTVRRALHDAATPARTRLRR